MIKIAFLLAVTSLVLGGEVQDKVKAVIHTCTEDDSNPDEILREFMDPDPKDENKCLYACLGKTIGAIKDGKLDVEFTNYIFKSESPDDKKLLEKGPAFIQQCALDTETEDECQYAYDILVCLKNGVEKIKEENK